MRVGQTPVSTAIADPGDPHLIDLEIRSHKSKYEPYLVAIQLNERWTATSRVFHGLSPSNILLDSKGFMQYTRTGLVLVTRNYQDCVDFYTNVLELPVLFVLDDENSKLTCCDMGSGVYLMIEPSSHTPSENEASEKNTIWLRFNVDDVEVAVQELKRKGVKSNVRREAWGTIADFVDPDGNRCSLRDEGTFG